MKESLKCIYTGRNWMGYEAAVLEAFGPSMDGGGWWGSKKGMRLCATR